MTIFLKIGKAFDKVYNFNYKLTQLNKGFILIKLIKFST